MACTAKEEEGGHANGRGEEEEGKTVNDTIYNQLHNHLYTHDMYCNLHCYH